MALKTTQRTLKAKYQTRIDELEKAIELQCASCMGFFLDPYEKCTSEICPLRKYYPTKGRTSGTTFRKRLINMAKETGQTPEIISQLVKGRG